VLQKKERRPAMKHTITIGMDLGDLSHLVVVQDDAGNELDMAKVINTKKAIGHYFKDYAGATVALEAGTHSPWISRLLSELGCTVYVGNPRKLRMIWDSKDKSDERDARMLAMVCRVEPKLLSPIKHRGRQAQTDLSLIRSREVLIKNRTSLINHARGLVKSFGERLPKCSAASFAKRCESEIPSYLLSALGPVFATISAVSDHIRDLDKQIETLGKARYPEAQLLQSVTGVGSLTALAFVLTIDDPARFSKSRQVGPYLGLTPRKDQSGQSDKQLPITKAGDGYLRQLLVSCAQYILGPFGPESHLRRHGHKLAMRGGKNAKKRAAIAVARKLSVLLHRMWVTGETYDPFYQLNMRNAS
jgi:transposase